MLVCSPPLPRHILGKEELNNNNNMSLAGNGIGGDFKTVLALMHHHQHELRMVLFRLDPASELPEGLLKQRFFDPTPEFLIR